MDQEDWTVNIRDIDPEYVRLNGPHYNRMLPRQQQGINRAKKGAYRALGFRAAHDEPGKGGGRK